jgi:hypothetical protein
LFSNILSPYSSLNVRDKVSYPYRTKGKIIAFYSIMKGGNIFEKYAIRWYEKGDEEGMNTRGGTGDLHINRKKKHF